MKVLRIVWAAPASVIGLLLSPFFERRSIVRGALVCEGASWPRRLGWRFRAITFGHVVLSVDDLDRAILDHELAHVRQYETYGFFMIPLYALGAAWVWLRGDTPYSDNPFEVAARRVARR